MKQNGQHPPNVMPASASPLFPDLKQGIAASGLLVADQAARLALTLSEARATVVKQLVDGTSWVLKAGGVPATAGDWVEIYPGADLNTLRTDRDDQVLTTEQQAYFQAMLGVQALLGAALQVPDAASRKDPDYYAGLDPVVVPYLGMFVSQADLPFRVFQLQADDVTLDASWFGFGGVDENGNLLVSGLYPRAVSAAEIATDVPGDGEEVTFPDWSGCTAIGDGVTTCAELKWQGTVILEVNADSLDGFLSSAVFEGSLIIPVYDVSHWVIRITSDINTSHGVSNMSLPDKGSVLVRSLVEIDPIFYLTGRFLLPNGTFTDEHPVLDATGHYFVLSDIVNPSYSGTRVMLGSHANPTYLGV